MTGIDILIVAGISFAVGIVFGIFVMAVMFAAKENSKNEE